MDLSHSYCATFSPHCISNRLFHQTTASSGSTANWPYLPEQRSANRKQGPLYLLAEPGDPPILGFVDELHLCDISNRCSLAWIQHESPRSTLPFDRSVRRPRIGKVQALHLPVRTLPDPLHMVQRDVAATAIVQRIVDRFLVCPDARVDNGRERRFAGDLRKPVHLTAPSGLLPCRHSPAQDGHIRPAIRKGSKDLPPACSRRRQYGGSLTSRARYGRPR